jgi:hypothetical protein
MALGPRFRGDGGKDPEIAVFFRDAFPRKRESISFRGVTFVAINALTTIGKAEALT